MEIVERILTKVRVPVDKVPAQMRTARKLIDDFESVIICFVRSWFLLLSLRCFKAVCQLDYFLYHITFIIYSILLFFYPMSE